MRYFIIAALLLGGCVTRDSVPPAVEVRTVTVEKPVPVACIDGKNVPAEPSKVGGQLTGQAAHDLDLVSGSAIKLRQWGRELMALVRPCVKP